MLPLALSGGLTSRVQDKDLYAEETGQEGTRLTAESADKRTPALGWQERLIGVWRGTDGLVTLNL